MRRRLGGHHPFSIQMQASLDRLHLTRPTHTSSRLSLLPELPGKSVLDTSRTPGCEARRERPVVLLYYRPCAWLPQAAKIERHDRSHSLVFHPPQQMVQRVARHLDRGHRIRVCVGAGRAPLVRGCPRLWYKDGALVRSQVRENVSLVVRLVGGSVVAAGVEVVAYPGDVCGVQPSPVPARAGRS